MSCFCLAENHVELFLSACCTRSTIILPVIQPIKLLICGVVAAVDVIDSKASQYSFLSANETSVQITLLKRQMREAICFLFCFVLTFFFQTVQELYDEYLMELSKSPYKDKDPHRDATFAYDAVWTIALTLNKSTTVLQQQNMTLEEFDYNNTFMRKTFMKYAKTLSFQGMSVSISE